MTSTASPTTAERLHTLRRAINSDILNSEMASNSDAYQSRLREVLREAETLWVDVRRGGYFGPSDTLEDLSTTALLALCLPYYIADLRQRVGGEGADREEVLTSAEVPFRELLQLAQDFEVISEAETERLLERHDRAALVEHERRQRALQETIDSSAQEAQREGYAALRRRRIAELEGNEDGDEGSTTDDATHRHALALCRWSMGDALTQLRLLKRERDMLQQVPLERRRAVEEAYQEGIAAARKTPKPSYTILPGGLMALRQQTADSLMTDRHGPTMTLKEFAESEMALMKSEMEAQKQMAEAQKAEDERLGVEGVEERERQRAAHWDDWRDANPTIGLTAKGNYA